MWFFCEDVTLRWLAVCFWLHCLCHLIDQWRTFLISRSLRTVMLASRNSLTSCRLTRSSTRCGQTYLKKVDATRDMSMVTQPHPRTRPPNDIPPPLVLPIPNSTVHGNTGDFSDWCSCVLHSVCLNLFSLHTVTSFLHLFGSFVRNMNDGSGRAQHELFPLMPLRILHSSTFVVGNCTTVLRTEDARLPYRKCKVAGTTLGRLPKRCRCSRGAIIGAVFKLGLSWGLQRPPHARSSMASTGSGGIGSGGKQGFEAAAGWLLLDGRLYQSSWQKVAVDQYPKPALP